MVSELVDDAHELVWAAEDLALTDEQADAVALLAPVAGQDVEPGEGPGQWRIAERTEPDRVISTVDPDARHAHKTRTVYRDGFKAHVAAGDAAAAPGLLEDEPAGTEMLGDSAYSSGELRAYLDQRGMEAVIKPPPLRPAVPGGFTLDDFTIDRQAGTVTCPEDITVTIRPAGTARFASHCQACPVRSQCTTAKTGRVIVLHPHHELLAAARQQAGTTVFDDTYRQHRPMIERTIAWLVKNNHRRLRHRGIEANRLAWSHRCAAVNLTRLLALGLTHNNGWAITPAT